MSKDEDNLSFYLSEMYKNLNIITSQLENSNIDEVKQSFDSDEDVVKLFEQQFSEWMGSFYNILIYLFCTTVAFLAALINLETRILPLVMFAFFPFYLWFTFLYSIPEIRFNNEVIFSRKDLTLKKQIQLARSLFNFFLRQMYENSKVGIMFLAGYVTFLGLIVIDEFILKLW